MKKTLLLVCVMVTQHLIYAQFTTPTIDGGIGSNEYGTHTNGNNQQVNNLTWYMTWDNTYLYIAVSNYTNANDALVFYIDDNPLATVNGGANSNGSLTGTGYDGLTATLPFRADCFLYLKPGYDDYKYHNSSGGWGLSTTNSLTKSYNDGNDVFEVRIPWSAVTNGGSRPSSFNFVCFGGYNTGLFADVPSLNPDGTMASVVLSYYHSVSATDDGSSVKPFSRISYATASGSQTLSTATNLFDMTLNGSTATLSAAHTIANKLAVASSSTLNTGGNLTVRSDASGTARIANSAGTISGNITVQRYVPAKSARKWSFVASPVQATIRSAWQSQAFITGVGTGGTACGTTGGNGSVGTDKYNTNGFDVSLGNAASLMQYNATQVSGSRWVSVANTSTNLVPGKGYRMNIRGERGSNDANCANQISSATPTAPAAVTLSATGAYPTGSALQATVFGTTATGGSNAFTLLGNPFPSELSFSAVQAANTTIGRKVWMYVGSNTGYSSWNNGTASGTWPAGYQTGSDVTIPSGSAFFVENTNSADATVTFAEAHKEATVVANGNTFQSRNTQTQNTWNVVRATLQETNGNYFDDCIIRFGNNAGIDNNTYTGFDGVSLNTGNSQYIASYKSGVSSVLTFNTRSQNYTNDTVKLFVKNTVNGTSQLKFTEHTNMPGEIILRDKFLNATQDIKANAFYNFNITTDPLSQGGERFELVFRSASTLPVQFVTVNAEKKATGAQVNFTVAKDEEAKNYVVERSNGNANFTAVATIDSKNQTGNVSYTALDNQAIQGTVLYRVKANSKNGGYVYSPTVKLAGDKGAVQLTLYPNPVKETLNIQTEGTIAGKVSIRIVNQLGEVMQTLNNVVISNSQVSMNVAKLPAGVYHVSISNGADYTAKGSFVK